MAPSPNEPASASAGPAAGEGLRPRVEQLGAALADTISAALATLPDRTAGPQALARNLGITTVTASRLLKALAQTDPVATVQLLPGPNPLRQLLGAASEKGAAADACAAALAEVETFDDLIRRQAGDRGALRAMLSAWLPEERREFEAQRRQSIFKALAELHGVSCDFELNCLLLKPGAREGYLDLVNVKGLIGIDRIRPDAVVRLATTRLATSGADAEDPTASARPRVPLNLDGDPALDGLHSVRLDDYCASPPAPLVAREFGTFVQYALGPTGFGPASKVDLVIAEVNRDELEGRAPNRERPPYFFVIPDLASRKLVFDLLVHRDVFQGCRPDVLAYDTASMGPANPGDPARELDLRPVPEPLQLLGSGVRRMRLLEFPRYVPLLENVFERLDWQADEFRCFRLAISYPLWGSQLTLAFRQLPDASA